MATNGCHDATTVHWHIADERLRRLHGPHGLLLSDWLRDGQAVIVKDGPHRAVYHVRLPGLDCHIKHYRLVGWRSRFRELLRPIKAKREYRLAQTLREREIPVPAPLAWGAEGYGVGPCASWLITETLHEACPLLSYLEVTLPTLPSTRSARVRQQLAHALGEFLARMHVSGIVHRDLHPGNLLLRFDADDTPRLWLIDLHTVRAASACPWSECRQNLAVFNRYFILRANRGDRLRFWQSYRDAVGSILPEPRRQMARTVERLTEESNAQFWIARDRRCLADNRYYRRVKTQSVSGHFVRDLSLDALAPLLADPDSPFTSGTATFLKSSRSSTVLDIDLKIGDTPRRVIYKRFRITDRRDPWLSLVRRCSALRSWIFGQGLRERQLPTPRPFAVFHRVRNGLAREGYLLTEKIEGAVELCQFAERLSCLPSAERTPELRLRMERLARLLRQMHRRGLSHRDLKASNILTAAEAGDARFWFIDLVGVSSHRRIGRKRKYQNLSRLHASFARHPLLSRTEKLRFLRSYLEWGLRGKSGWKEWWRSIDTATQAKVARNQLSGRPLT